MLKVCCLCTFYGFPDRPHVSVYIFTCKGPVICVYSPSCTCFVSTAIICSSWALRIMESFFHPYRFQEKSSCFITIPAFRVSQFYSTNTQFTTFPCCAPTLCLPASPSHPAQIATTLVQLLPVNKGPCYSFPKSSERIPHWKRNFQKKKKKLLYL